MSFATAENNQSGQPSPMLWFFDFQPSSQGISFYICNEAEGRGTLTSALKIPKALSSSFGAA